MALSSISRRRPTNMAKTPDLAIHQILQSLPTKSSIRLSCISKQSQGLWSLTRFIDLVERDEHDDEANCSLDQHRKFVNILKMYLEYRQEHVKLQKHGHVALLREVRLRMSSYIWEEDRVIVTKLLAFIFERKVQELDLSLGISKPKTPISDENRVGLYHCLSRTTFLKAGSLTSLNLEHVRINLESFCTSKSTELLLPCVKTVSLKDAHFDGRGFFLLICECPSIEYLSLTSCSFGERLKFKPYSSPVDFTTTLLPCLKTLSLEDMHLQRLYLSSLIRECSSSLKTLQFKDCNVSKLDIVEVKNLESFTFLGSSRDYSSPIHTISLNSSANLKRVNIRAHQLKSLSLLACHETLEATIHTPNLEVLRTLGFLKSKFHMEAPREKCWVEMVLWEIWDTSNGGASASSSTTWEHLNAVRNFLQQFSFARQLTLYVGTYPALVFPENFRNAFPSPIFPSLECVSLVMCHPVGKVEHLVEHLEVIVSERDPILVREFYPDFSELRESSPDWPNSLIWLAPSAKKFTTSIYSTQTGYMTKTNPSLAMLTRNRGPLKRLIDDETRRVAAGGIATKRMKM